MNRIIDTVRRHPLLAFYLLTFSVSWGGVFIAAGGPDGFPADPEELTRLLPAVALAIVIGPLLVGLLLTAATAGFGTLRGRLQTWRVNPGWYAVVLFTAPAMVLVAALPLSIWSADFVPSVFTADDRVALVLTGLVSGLVAGLCEELGWTAFAVPRLLARHGVFATGLIAGLLWGLWHVIAAYWGAGTPDGRLSPLILANQLAFYFGVLPAYRILMVWVFDRTHSLPLTMLMHASLSAFTITILASPVDDVQRLVLYLVEAGICWGVVAIAAMRGAFRRPSATGTDQPQAVAAAASA
jgi:uncharacterized protein